MNKIILPILLLICLLGFSQETLKPKLDTKTDISAQAQATYAEMKQKYEKLLIKQNNGKTTKAEAQWLLDNEMKVVDGNPFSTLVEYDPESWGDIAHMKDVTSTSHLKSSKSTNYEISNAQDYDLRTAWATNTNKGIDEKITFSFNAIEGIKVTYIEIHNGYQKSEEAWENNSRAKKIEVCIGGEPLYVLELGDTIKKQRFSIAEWPLSKDANLIMEFRILEVYPGKKYQDLCISEIDFGGIGN